MARGYRPFGEDFDWRHDHVATGETRACSRPGCKATWPVFCHNGHKQVCSVCRRAIRRVRDRQAKAGRRFARQDQRDEFELTYGLATFQDAERYADDLAAAGYDYDEAKEMLREWLADPYSYQDDLEYGDDGPADSRPDSYSLI